MFERMRVLGKGAEFMLDCKLGNIVESDKEEGCQIMKLYPYH